MFETKIQLLFNSKIVYLKENAEASAATMSRSQQLELSALPLTNNVNKELTLYSSAFRNFLYRIFIL
jgi:hypothetical protein